MKTIYQLYVENGHRAGFVVRNCHWPSGFATVHSVDGRARGGSHDHYERHNDRDCHYRGRWWRQER